MAREYFLSSSEVYSEFDTSQKGLSTSEADRRFAEYGPNKLKEAREKTLPEKVWAQIKDPMVLILIAAAFLSAAFGEVADTAIILVVVVVNTILGIYQEGKAEDAIKALQKSSAPHSLVRRDGVLVSIDAQNVVPGDVVILEAGDIIPADMRLISTASMKVEEAALTGESVPVDKSTEALVDPGDEIPLGDRANMAYRGTSVTYGHGEGVVVSTGMNTEMGKIAEMIAEVTLEKTPLQKKLAGLSRVLSIAVIGICIFIFGFMVIREGSLDSAQIFDALLISISLAVAAIPEGLVVVVTVLLSIGVTKMSKKHAIIRRLTAVETLGCTQVICSDKTGTLTQNKMTVVEHEGDERALAKVFALCNDATYGAGGTMVGDPTETALLQYGLGFYGQDELAAFARVAEIPFDSDRKMMTTFNKEDTAGYIQLTKGAPDEILKRCTRVLQDGKNVALTEALQERILADNTAMAGKALRVLAAATKPVEDVPQDPKPEHYEKDMTFIGLVGMIDPIRPEAKEAVDRCKKAGITVVMITGDHQDTARAIGENLGIITSKTQVITGAELRKMPQEEFAHRIGAIAVYARVQPEDKVRIVDAWQEKGKITAMTGDGVNDAPALKTADIGIGMGITGTEVSKSVSDMILTDDNFATIVAAVDEGRRIYENIRKVIQFLLGSNLSEVFAIFIATLLGWRLFSPIHILWINLVTDTLPALALGMEEEQGSMDKPPRDPNESVFARGLGVDIIWQGVSIGLLTLFSFAIGFAESQVTGMTMAFITLSMCEIFHSMNMRSRMRSIFSLKKQNKYLWAAMALSFVLTLGVVYTPGLNTVFHLEAIPVYDFVWAMLISASIIPLVEIVKFVRRRFTKGK